MAGRRNDVFTGLRVSTKDGMEIPYPSAPSSAETNRTVEPERPFFISSDAFVQRVLPIAEEHLRRLNQTQLGGQPVNPDAVRISPNAPQFKGSNYTAQIATVNGRPHLLVQREDGQLFAKPLEQFLDIRQWFNPHLVLADSSESGAEAPQPAAAQTPATDASGQPQPRPMNIFEYMEKLPPQERLVFTILLYLLISETMGRIFQRGGGNRQSPPIAWQTPWMPGPPKGQQWMIWG